MILSAPFGAEDGLDVQFQKLLRGLMRPSSEFASLADSVGYHASLLQLFILELSKHFPAVSPSGVVGLHMRDGKRVVARFSEGHAELVTKKATREHASELEPIMAALLDEIHERPAGLTVN